MGRVFEQGDLRLVVLALLAEQPRHGYDIIKEIESRAGGAYSPSPGVIYPLLSMLEEMGLVEMAPGEGAKKSYAVTEAGKAALADEKAAIEALFARLAAVRERFAEGRAPQIIRAMENLKFALRLRLERGGLDEAQVSGIAAVIDAAARQIEQT